MSQEPERVHARFNASAAARWLRCTKSVTFTQDMPDTSTPHAKDGTEAHDLLDFCVKNRIWLAELGHGLGAFSDKWTFRVDTFEERIASVQECLSHVKDTLDLYGEENCTVFAEEKFDLDLSSAPGMAFGYSDICILVKDLGLFIIIDFKHGSGVVVEIEDEDGPNEQLSYYAAGVLRKRPDIQVKRVILTIVQPRAYHPQSTIRSVEVTPGYLSMFVMRCDAAAGEALGPDAKFAPSPKACKWCKGRSVCPAVEKESVEAFGFVSIPDVSYEKLPSLTGATVDRLLAIRKAGAVLAELVSEANNRLFELAKTGTAIPGHKLVETRATTKWSGKTTDITAKLQKEYPSLLSDDIAPRSLIGITDARRVLKQAAFETGKFKTAKEAAEHANITLSEVTLKQPSGNLKLVDENDPAPAWSPVSPFTNVQLPD